MLDKEAAEAVALIVTLYDLGYLGGKGVKPLPSDVDRQREDHWVYYRILRENGVKEKGRLKAAR